MSSSSSVDAGNLSAIVIVKRVLYLSKVCVRARSSTLAQFAVAAAAARLGSTVASSVAVAHHQHHLGLCARSLRCRVVRSVIIVRVFRRAPLKTRFAGAIAFNRSLQRAAEPPCPRVGFLRPSILRGNRTKIRRRLSHSHTHLLIHSHT